MDVLVNDRIVSAMVDNRVELVCSVPCKQLAGVLVKLEQCPELLHVPVTREDEGMAICAGAFLGGRRAAMVMQNTALGVTINALAALIQFYRLPLPMLISYRGEVGERIACQVEMAIHTKPLLAQLQIPTYHFRQPAEVSELSEIIEYCYMCSKPVAVLAEANFWREG